MGQNWSHMRLPVKLLETLDAMKKEVAREWEDEGTIPRHEVVARLVEAHKESTGR